MCSISTNVELFCSFQSRDIYVEANLAKCLPEDLKCTPIKNCFGYSNVRPSQ